jgi:hypothetical protein
MSNQKTQDKQKTPPMTAEQIKKATDKAAVKYDAVAKGKIILK